MVTANKQKKTYAQYCEEQWAKLTPIDHILFNNITNGLRKMGWREQGGGKTFRLLTKFDATIKIFRQAESPDVIHICFSAPPENEEKWLKEVKERSNG